MYLQCDKCDCTGKIFPKTGEFRCPAEICPTCNGAGEIEVESKEILLEVIACDEMWIGCYWMKFDDIGMSDYQAECLCKIYGITMDKPFAKQVTIFNHDLPECLDWVFDETDDEDEVDASTDKEKVNSII